MHSESLVKADLIPHPFSPQAVDRIPKRNTWGTAAAAFVLALALMIVPAQQAFAHDYLMGSNPEDGATIDVHPTQIVLSFNNNIQKLGAQMIILDEKETVLATGEPVVEGKNVSFDVPANLGNGAFAVNWRVVSSDSHPIDGTLSYTVTNAPGTDVSAPSPEDTPEADLPADQPENQNTTPGTTTGTDSAPAPDKPGLPWTGIFIGGGLGLAAGIVLLLLGKRKNKND